MIKPKIYLDTTVPSTYFDERTPDRRVLTVEFWETRLPSFEPVISELLRTEVGRTPDEERRKRILDLVNDFKTVPLDKEARDLAQVYLDEGIFSIKTLADAQHVAIAVVNGIGYLISWNYRHLVRLTTRRQVNLVNSLRGFEPIEILTPAEL